ncbi:MAG: glycosyltransferase [Paludibacter sp.]|nr:glycosyltransferase [Paludibacter sp.]
MSILKNNKIRTIGLFNDSYPPIMDGVAMVTKNTAHWLYQMNQPVCVVTPKTPNYTITDPYPVYRYFSLPFIFRRPYRFGLSEFDFSFQDTINRIPFGLVHAHCPFTSGLLALRIAKKQKIPFVATFHSKYRDDFERTFKNKNVSNFMVKELIKFYEKADEVWIPQAAVEETIREYGFKGKVVVVENGNDFADTESKELLKAKSREYLNVERNKLILLFVGQHIWEKNIKMIVEALSLIKIVDFKMFFVGTGYASDNLKQMIIDAGLSNKVEFIGVVLDRSLIKKYYAAADLFVFPSIYDNAPLVVREAAALQTPSILIKDSTASEIIRNDYNGFLVDNSAEALAVKIDEIAKNPQIGKSVGINASNTIARSWEDITAEIYNRYNHLMDTYSR